MCQPRTSYCHLPDSAQLCKRDRVLNNLYTSVATQVMWMKKLSKAAVIFIKQALMKRVSHGTAHGDLVLTLRCQKRSRRCIPTWIFDDF